MNSTDTTAMIVKYTALGTAGVAAGTLLWDRSGLNVFMFALAVAVYYAVSLRRPIGKAVGWTSVARKYAARGMDVETREVFLAARDAGLYPRREDADGGAVTIRRRGGIFRVEREVIPIDNYDECGMPATLYQPVVETWVLSETSPGERSERFRSLTAACDRAYQWAKVADLLGYRP